MSVGLLVVSHSTKIAEGTCELAAQMAPDVLIAPAGGAPDGSLGTSLEVVQRGILATQRGDGVVILVDVGSARMIAESAVELLEDHQRLCVLLVADAPLVEGTLAAAVVAQTGADLPAVAAAARAALWGAKSVVGRLDRGIGTAPGSETGSETGSEAVAGGEAGAGSGPEAGGGTELINPLGLHARPAAALAQAMTSMEAEVTINGVDAKSVLLLMTLGLQQGQQLTVSARGTDAHRAVEWVLDQARGGFGEL